MAEFWNSSTLEPKRQHRWLLTMRNSQVPSYVVKVADKPGFSINETTHDYFGHKFYYPGQVEWSEISITLVDAIDPDSSKLLQNVLTNSGYQDPSNHPDNMLFTVSKADSVKALGPQVTLKQVSGAENKTVEKWTLYNPWIKEVKFGSLDYSSDDLVEIELTIRYDWARLSQN